MLIITVGWTMNELQKYAGTLHIKSLEKLLR